MLYQQKVVAALEQKRSRFTAYQTAQQNQASVLRSWLTTFARYDAAALLARLDQLGVAWPGARPTAELDRATQLCLPFQQEWNNHADARAWALVTLKDRPSAAVDGSQILPTKDFSLPIGAVQIGWFVNFHRAGGSYIKDVAFEVLAPDELADEDDAGRDLTEGNFANGRVSQLRFVLECEKLCELMALYADVAEPDRPLFFFDGSLIISFAGQMLPRHAQPYVRAVQQLLACSARYRVPLVGFVDSSLSQDLTTLISLLQSDPAALSLTDGGLIKLARLLPAWGDRTPLFECARHDGLSRTGQATFYGDVLFTYIQLAMERPPARLELPRWLLEAGRADEIIDLVRAECVVGTGYPYVIETADALAVISQQDRQRFYAFFEQFAQRAGLQITHARKALSKQSRR
jgi:hypothetical protein